VEVEEAAVDFCSKQLLADSFQMRAKLKGKMLD